MGLPHSKPRDHLAAAMAIARKLPRMTCRTSLTLRLALPLSDFHPAFMVTPDATPISTVASNGALIRRVTPQWLTPSVKP